MGFFSWKTADDDQSIYNRYSECGARPVYLIQPEGRPAILEPNYEGYGIFGGTDAYVWLARENLPAEKLAPYPDDADLSTVTVRSIGITLAFGYKFHKPTGTKFVSRQAGASVIDPEIVNLSVMWDEPVDIFGGRTLNEVSAAGEIESRSFPIAFPLKFSHDADATYEDLRASNDCPEQGFFVAHDDDDLDDEEEEEIEDEIEDDEDLDRAA